MNKRKDRKRGKSRADLERYLHKLMQKCEDGNFEPTDFDQQIIDKISLIYDAFVMKLELTGREATPNQQKLLENWAKILDRDTPHLKAA